VVLSRAACVEFEGVIVLHETDDALLVKVYDQEVWIPKSHIHNDSDVYEADTEGALIISEWIAEKKELV
jgi:hypothetical protein